MPRSGTSERVDAARQHAPVPQQRQRLEPAAMPAHHAQRGFGHLQRPGEKRDHGSIGLALVGHRLDAQPQHDRAIIADFRALDGVTPGIGGDANEKAQPAGAEPIAFGLLRQG